jgi:putative redox protein
MNQVINVQWRGDMTFEAEVDEHKVVFDARPEAGGKNKGASPKPFLMASLAGCTGMDVVSILKKMKVDLVDFNVKVEGIVTDEHPKRYTAMHVIYEFSGNNLSYDKIKHACELSQEKYCGVIATLNKAVEISYDIKIKELS